MRKKTRKAEQAGKEKPRVFGYCRVSTVKQNLERQRLAIHDYARDRGWIVERFINAKVSTRK